MIPLQNNFSSLTRCFHFFFPSTTYSNQEFLCTMFPNINKRAKRNSLSFERIEKPTADFALPQIGAQANITTNIATNITT